MADILFLQTINRMDMLWPQVGVKNLKYIGWIAKTQLTLSKIHNKVLSIPTGQQVLQSVSIGDFMPKRT